VGGVGGVVGVGVWGCGVVSSCVRTFQGLHSVRLWTPTILKYQKYQKYFMPKLVRSKFRVGMRKFGGSGPLVWEKIENEQTVLKGFVKLLYR
jgi:hypothetical protein